MGARRRWYTPEEIAAKSAEVERRPGRPSGPNHLASAAAARAFLLQSGIFADPTPESVDHLLHEAAVLAQRIALPFDELRATRWAATLAKGLRNSLFAIEALPSVFRRDGMQREILGHIESGLRSGLFHLGPHFPQLIPEQDRSLDPERIERLRRDVAAASNKRVHLSFDDARRWYAAEIKVGMEKLTAEHRDENHAFYLSLSRCKPRVRFLVLLFYSMPGAINLEPIELAALALAVGLRGEVSCAKAEAEDRAAVWGKAKVSAMARDKWSPFTRDRQAWIARMNSAVGEAQTRGMSRTGPVPSKKRRRRTN